MRRQHHSEKYELSDAEKRDLIKLINEGKPLPEKYRFLLFEDKRQVELVWNGKTREVSTARRAKPNAQAALLINLVKRYPDTVQRLATI